MRQILKSSFTTVRYRYVFLGGCTLFGAVLYYLGYLVNRLRWGDGRRDEDDDGRGTAKRQVKTEAKQKDRTNNEEEGVRKRKKPRKYY